MLTTAVPKPEPRTREKARRKRQQARADRSVYDAVTLRDGSRCRVCGSGGHIHRHHLEGRSSTTTATVVCVCQTCHADLHPRVGGKRLVLTGNADSWLTVRIRVAGVWCEGTV